MRIYQSWALGNIRPEEAFKYDPDLAKFAVSSHSMMAIKQHWLKCGKWYEVPKGACYVLHYAGKHYWAEPGSEDEVRKLSQSVLHLATFVPPTMSEVTKKDGSVTRTRTLPDNPSTVAAIMAQMNPPRAAQLQ